jgi:hypothetical protein
MAKKLWMLIALAVVLGGISLYLNRDYFSKEDIQILSRSRPARAAIFSRKKQVDTGAIDPIYFDINRKLKLTSIKVISVNEAATNKFPHLLWHLTSESNSVPIKDFSYGSNIKGMHPEVKGATPDPLEPGVQYRLLVEAGPVKAAHDFVPSPRTP